MNIFGWFKRKPAVAVPVAPDREQLTPQPLRVTNAMLQALAGKRRRPDEPAAGMVNASPFGGLPVPPPGVRPAGATMAMDDGITASVSGWAQSNLYGEGLAFMGYPYLAELAQRPEYRNIISTYAQQMTRKWVKLVSTGDDDKSERIAALDEAMKRFGLRDAFRQGIELDGFFGCGQIFVDLGVTDDTEELRTPLLRDKKGMLTSAKIGRGSLKGFVVVEPIWTSPSAYNSTNPLRPDFYKPSSWYVMGQEVHHTRLLTFISREVPDILKPSYNFGGLSMSQIAKPYVDNWLRTRQSVSDLLHSFTVFVLKTTMQSFMSDPTALSNRLAAFILGRDNKGLMILDKEGEEFENVTAPLGSLDKLQAQAQEQLASVAQLPLVWLLGVTPAGLNASADGEIRVFYDRVKAGWEAFCGAHLTTALQIIQLSEFGEIDPEIGYEFLPLWELDDAGRAGVQKTKADTDAVYLADGVVSPDEVRARLAADPESPYHGLEGEAPEPPEVIDPDGGEGSNSDDGDGA